MEAISDKDRQLCSLTSLSSVDGRYYSSTKVLRPYFSEYAYFKYRLHIEITYLVYLLQKIPTYSSITEEDIPKLNSIITEFSPIECLKIKKHESLINHDVKAIEYYIRDKLKEHGINKYNSFIHFGLTSQDINNTALPLMLRDTIDSPYIYSLNAIVRQIDKFSEEWKNVIMISRTHGQPAVPTTFGKELKTFSYRIGKEKEILANMTYYAKFGGAVGNMNAHVCAFPDINWKTFVNKLLDQFYLKRSEFTSQIENYENMSRIFDNLKRINCILIDFCTDMWLYISSEYLKLAINTGEVGSSTMPHKVNPINFENAEANLKWANAQLEFLSRDLPISRLQRDLTDSTLTRNIGSIFGHMLIAYRNISVGLNKIEVNQHAITSDLSKHVIVIIEGVQTILRKYKYEDAYEKCKEFSRTNTNINILDLEDFVTGLDIEDYVRYELHSMLDIKRYIGYACMENE
jgi:adenylosuccinate lyase